MKIIKDNSKECIIVFYEYEIKQVCSFNDFNINIHKIARGLLSLHYDILQRTVYYKTNDSFIPRNLYYLNNIFIIAFFKYRDRNMLLDEAVNIKEIAIKFINFLHYYTYKFNYIISFTKELNIDFDYIYRYKERYFLNAPIEYLNKFQIFSGEFMLIACSIDKSFLIEHGEEIFKKNASHILKVFY